MYLFLPNFNVNFSISDNSFVAQYLSLIRPLSSSVYTNLLHIGMIYDSCLDFLTWDLQNLAKKYGRTPAQIALRWGIQRKTVVIPKSSRVERLEENIKIFDYELSNEDMEIIKGIDKNYRTNRPAKFWGIDLFA